MFASLSKKRSKSNLITVHMKVLLIAIIGVLVYNSPDMRTTIADGLDWTSEAIRPESQVKFNLPSIDFN